MQSSTAVMLVILCFIIVTNLRQRLSAGVSLKRKAQTWQCCVIWHIMIFQEMKKDVLHYSESLLTQRNCNRKACFHVDWQWSGDI